MAAPQLPTGSLVVRVDGSGAPFYEAKWRHDSRQVKRRIGAAWLVRDGNGSWTKRKGRPRPDCLDEKRATVRMAELIARHAEEVARERALAAAEASRGPTFRTIAADWLEWLADVKRAKPSTLTDYRYMLAEPGTPHRRGGGRAPGRILDAFGDREATEITVRDVSTFLRDLDQTAISARTVNKHRQLLVSVFNYAMRLDTHSLPSNPAAATDKRREPPAARLEFYEPDEVERLAAAAAEGRHRAPAKGRGGGLMALSDAEVEAREREDRQLSELFRVLAFTGLRLGEVVALQWGDVDLAAGRLVVQRAASAGQEGPTKGWQVRYIPLATQASDALRRLADRQEFTQHRDYVFVNRIGARLDPSAIRRRFHAAREAAGLRRLKLHGLRHGAGSLVARETDPIFVQHFLGHARLSTTERYMHAKARRDDIDRLDRAFASSAAITEAG